MHKTIFATAIVISVWGLVPAAYSDDGQSLTKKEAAPNAQMQGEGAMNHDGMSGMKAMMKMMEMMQQMEPMMERCNEMMAAMSEDHDSKSLDSGDTDDNS